MRLAVRALPVPQPPQRRRQPPRRHAASPIVIDNNAEAHLANYEFPKVGETVPFEGGPDAEYIGFSGKALVTGITGTHISVKWVQVTDVGKDRRTGRVPVHKVGRHS